MDSTNFNFQTSTSSSRSSSEMMKNFHSYAKDAAQFEFDDEEIIDGDDNLQIQITNTKSSSINLLENHNNNNYGVNQQIFRDNNNQFSLNDSRRSQQISNNNNNNIWISNDSQLSSQSSSSSRKTLSDISNRYNNNNKNNFNRSFNKRNNRNRSFNRNNHNNTTSKTLNTSILSQNVAMNTTTTSNIYQSEIIMSIVEGRGKAKGEIGIAFIDLKSIPIINVSQFVDNYSFDAICLKCQIHTPTEIIFPHTMSSNNRMMSTLIETFPDIIYRPFNRKFFNEKRGFDIIQMLSYDDCQQWIDLQLETKYYCLASCSALFHYLIMVRQIQYAPKSIKIIYQSSLNTMIIDPLTAKILELIINSDDPKSWHTLFCTINRTKTKSGFILLRSNILQPTTNLELINKRLDMIDAISSSIEIFNSFENILDSFGTVDLDQLLMNMTLVPIVNDNNNNNGQSFSNDDSNFFNFNKSNDITSTTLSMIKSSSSSLSSSSVSPAIIRFIEKKIDYVINMKHVTALVEHLRTLLINCNTELFSNYIRLLEDHGFDQIKSMIDQVINSEARCLKSTFGNTFGKNTNTFNSTSSAAMKLERCFAIKDRFNPMLDIARNMYSETIDDIIALTQAYEVKYCLPGIRIAFNSSKGFHMQIKSMKSNDRSNRDMNNNNLNGGLIFNRPTRLPSIFKDVHVTKNCISFTSDDLMRLNSRVRQSIEEIYLQSDNIITKLIEQIRTKISCLYNLTDIVANIDLIYSFAYQSLCANWIRPQFNSHYTEIIQGTHPVLDNVCGGNSVPNSIFLSNDLNFHIITGPNMSGKTTFLKQIGLIQILAQIGSFVPAQMNTTFRLCDKIFTRMALNDNLQINSSSFMVEIKELHYILEHISPNCLILIDELGRDSCPDDNSTNGTGENISFDNNSNNGDSNNFSTYWSFCESLLMSQSSFTIFATHFSQLTTLSKYYFNVSNYHFSSEERLESNLLCRYPHLLRSGPTKERFYGILLAEQSGLDEKIVFNAKIIAQRFRPTSSMSHSLSMQLFLNISNNNDNDTIIINNNNDDNNNINNEQYAELQAKYRIASKIIHLIKNTNTDLSLSMNNIIDTDIRRDLQIMYEELKQEFLNQLK